MTNVRATRRKQSSGKKGSDFTSSERARARLSARRGACASGGPRRGVTRRAGAGGREQAGAAARGGRAGCKGQVRCAPLWQPSVHVLRCAPRAQGGCRRMVHVGVRATWAVCTACAVGEALARKRLQNEGATRAFQGLLRALWAPRAAPWGCHGLDGDVSGGCVPNRACDPSRRAPRSGQSGAFRATCALQASRVGGRWGARGQASPRHAASQRGCTRRHAAKAWRLCALSAILILMAIEGLLCYALTRPAPCARSYPQACAAVGGSSQAPCSSTCRWRLRSRCTRATWAPS